MTFTTFSPRQRLAMLWWKDERYKDRDGIICDGSVRSGKTVSMSIGFILWAMANYNKQLFAICGRTVGSVRRNIIIHIPTWLEGLMKIKQNIAENKLVISCGETTNTFYIFGGRDESSYTLIQGITLAGALLDEVALMPQSFVQQVFLRCSVTGSKIWCNCNPESPTHWFYLEWVKQSKQRNMLHLHFTMADNYSLSEKIKARYESQFSGLYYDRYILGLWVLAEGLIYTMFDREKHIVKDEPRNYTQYMISCDYGILNPTSVGLWGRCNDVWYRIREYYYDGRKHAIQRTDEEHYAALEELAGNLPIKKVIVDPSAASFIEVIRRHGRFYVEHASNAVLDGIRDVATQLKAGKILICENCVDCIREFGLYSWDIKANGDAPIKTNDHAMDDMRYFVRAAFAPSRFGFN